ncbi:hypothetical protein ACOBR2_06865 [Telmatobacter bradus]|uniref:hypothetical protein n=1 Tax=Telmatobacter bradus TaxID=474953 RepID=UPI003B4355FE
MRRVAAIVQLLVLVLLCSAPLLRAATWSDDSGLPPCCRRHGKHHCAMLDAYLRARRSGKPSVSAPPGHCPCYPQPGSHAIPVQPTLGTIEAALNPLGPHVVEVLELVLPQLLAHTTARSAHGKRGPPVLL